MNTAQQRCAFYAPTLDEDSGRVDCLFAAAAHEQVAVREAALSETELYNLLRAETMLVIALVDGRLLYGGDGRPADERGGVGNGSNDSGGNQPKGNCSGNRSGKSNGSSKGSMHHNNSSSARGGSSSDGSSHNCGSQYSSSLFAGHYVLLVGLDDASGGVLVKDPARAEEAIVASIDRLEHARHAFARTRSSRCQMWSPTRHLAAVNSVERTIVVALGGSCCSAPTASADGM